MDRRGEQARPARFTSVKAAPVGIDAVHAALAEGRPGDAADAYFALPPALARGALSADQAVELASWLRANGHSPVALSLLRRVVRDVPRGSGLADACALAGVILFEDLHEPTAAYQYLLTALELDPRPDTEATVRRALAAIEDLQKRRVGQLRRPGF
jgi:hypothetical protein